jgi:hypothetical protein
MSHSEDDTKIGDFVHRTFNGQDFSYKEPPKHLQKIMMDSKLFSLNIKNQHQFKSISEKKFFEIPHQYHVKKHVSDPMNGSAAKRINMF